MYATGTAIVDSSRIEAASFLGPFARWEGFDDLTPFYELRAVAPGGCRVFVIPMLYVFFQWVREKVKTETQPR